MKKFAWPARAGILYGAGVMLLALSVGGCTDSSPGPVLELRTLSNRADLVSGGDAMVEVALPSGAAASSVKVDVDGRDVSSAFALRSNGKVTGLVTGLANGSNVVSASADGASPARLTITNAPRGGPVLSGPQTVPFFCATPTPQGATANAPATNGSGLSTFATDAQCSIATEFKLYYKTTTAGCATGLPDPSAAATAFTSTTLVVTTAAPAANNCFKPYDPAAAAPADLATTVTDAGLTVPFIVRVERGTMNRGIYDIVALFDPAKPWTATAPQAQWNGKLLYNFSASTGQPRRQARPQTNWTSTSQATGNIDPQTAIAKGYIWVDNSMTDSSINSNRVSMAETVMMMKEHISDTYGAIKYTHGTGCSGGSINSNTNSSIAPGQLDGITISCAFPDSETTAIEVADCVALVEAYQKPQWLALVAAATPEQIVAKKAAINGHVDQTGCHGWFNAFGSNSKAGTYNARFVGTATGAISVNPVSTNNCQMLPSQVYDPVTNPTGARCSAWDWAASIFGKAPDGRGLSTPDNEGIQYGLKAMLAGTITPEEFVTINEIAGGADKDSVARSARSVADAAALTVAYQSGIVMDGRNNAKTAVIDMRGWDDASTAATPTNVHFVWRSFSIRDRLDRDFGDHNNQVMWRFGLGGLGAPPTFALDSLSVMDQWLTTLKGDASSATLAQKVRSAKPSTAFDFCVLSTDATQSTRVTNQATCDADPRLKFFSSPRQVAGGPLSENILKCQLRAVNDTEYAGKLSADQLARLRALFTTGVCDWTRAGVGQQASLGPLTYKAGPGGAALPEAPVSSAK